MNAVHVLGVEIADLAFDQAVAHMAELVSGKETKTLYYVNAHTLNCASDDPSYRDVLNSADVVFGDGTGVRWGARMGGTRVKANLNGTDLTPAFLDATSGRGLRYYLLGATEETVERAALHCRARFAGWELVGFRNGYLLDQPIESVLEDIAKARPNLLLVGMGNPLQEWWIHDHRDRLDVPLVVGVGGLFNYWGGLPRAPAWVRYLGFEWVYVLLRHPWKARRYLLGNPLYLFRVAREALWPAAR